MAGDDAYRDDPYGERRDGADDARPGRRRATQPARPAWDAMTYGRPDDMRLPPRAPRRAPEPEPPAPAADVDHGESTYWSAPVDADRPYESSSYRPAYPAATDAYRTTAEAYPAATESYPPPTSYPGPSPTGPAGTGTDSYAPGAHTSFEGPSEASAPPSSTGENAVYVASGLYLDGDHGTTNGGGAGWPTGDATGPVAANPGDPPPAGRLPAFGSRLAVGLGLGAIVLASLLLWRPAFLGVVVLAVALATWELGRAVRSAGANPPLIPLVVGGALMAGLAWWGGTVALTFGLAVTMLAAMAWRFAEGVAGYGRDITAAALIAVYVPFLGGFAAMLASPHDGHLRVLATLIAVVLSDTGGYLVGAKLGRHPMAPSVSPKKSWEGLAGSLVAAALGSAVVLSLMFHVAAWWGLLFGLAIAIASVIGDLGESMLKRDLGVKDMSGLLPGHGGIMDRLDSILLAAPAGYLMLWAIVPVTP